MNNESNAKSNQFKKSSMTNKTTYAMFAIVAIAAMSFGLAPAFAATNTYEMEDTALAGSTESTSSGRITGLCGGGGYGYFNMDLSQSNPGNEDSLKATWNLTCGVSYDDIDVSIYKKVNGNWVQDGVTQNSSSTSAYYLFAPTITGGDEWKITFVINY